MPLEMAQFSNVSSLEKPRLSFSWLISFRSTERIREKEQSNPKFSFLSPGDAYAAYYLWRLDEIKEGRGTDVSAGRPGEAVVTPVPEKPKGPASPPEFHFSARMPIINAQDLEVVKLTALFVAKRGEIVYDIVVAKGGAKLSV